MLVYLEEVAVALPLWAFTDDLTDAELSPSSSISLAFCRSSVEATILVQSQPEKRTMLKKLVAYLIHADSSQWLFDGSVQKWHPGQTCGLSSLEECNKSYVISPRQNQPEYHEVNPMCQILWSYIPKPENPMTDAMSPSPIILPDAAKKGLSYYVMKESINLFIFCFFRPSF